MLFPEGGLRFSRLSKAARGYLLAEQGRIDPPLAPRNAVAIALDPDQIAEQAARDVLRECLDQIATQCRGGPQARRPRRAAPVADRPAPLRSAFFAFAPVLESPEMERLNDEARWLGQVVGRLRDLDVVANDIVRREAATHPDEPGLSALADALLRQAGELRDCVRKLLAEARVQAFLIDLVRFVETRGWLVPQDFEQTGRLAAPVAELAGQRSQSAGRRSASTHAGLRP